MKRLFSGECIEDNVFELVDPTGFLEIDFEAETVKALNCLLRDYWCGVFAGSFVLEGERRLADLALIHKSLSHWFVIEVELAGHSLHRHVLPQVRCFRYGEPEHSCIRSLTRAFPSLTEQQAESILTHVPRFVAVVGNIKDPEWDMALSGLDVQYLIVSIYRNRSGKMAHEVEGRLIARSESLGFATFSATDNCLRINKASGLPMGALQLIDQFGTPTSWTVREASGTLWISKDSGPALLEHESHVQIIRTIEGRLLLRPSLAQFRQKLS